MVRETAHRGNATEWATSATDERFDLVVGVAPFGERGRGADADAGEQGDERSARAIEALATVVSDEGAGTMIAPSSIVTSVAGVTAEARDLLLDRFKTAEFLNYDRTVEPLLGPADWTSRTIIRVLVSGTGSVTTTPMMRWRPERRSVVLTEPPNTTLFQPPPLGKHSFVPRIGSHAERRLVDSIIAHQSHRWNLIGVELSHGDFRSDNEIFSVGLTAKDRFSIALAHPRIYFGEAPTRGARYGIRPQDPKFGDPALAVLLSRTALWWWLATGDGLHVRQEHITEPLSWLRLLDQEELDLGTEVANSWRNAAPSSGGEGAEPASARDEAAKRIHLISEFEKVLLARLGTTVDDAREILTRKSFVDV